MTIGLCWIALGCSPQSSEGQGQGGSGTGGKLSSGGAAGTGSGGSGAGGARGGATGSGGATSDTGGVSGTGGRGNGGLRQGGSSGAAGGAGGLGRDGGAAMGGRGGADTGTGGQSDPGGGPTSITGLKIDGNPKSVLAAFVTWTTDKPGDSVVQFGQGKYEWEISDSELVTSHKVLIIGMVAGKSYQIKAMSSAGGTPVSATGSYTTKALPSQIPVATVTASDPTKVQPGWTLMNIIKSNSASAPISNDPAMAVMYDATGQPVWYYIDGTAKDYGGATATYLTDKGVLVGPIFPGSGSSGESPREVDFAGNTIWDCKDPKCGGAGNLTHDTIKLSNGNHVVLRWNDSSMDATFEELDATNKVVWSVGFGDLVPKPAGATGDWCHGNSVVIDIAKDTVYLNCRFMGLVKTSYKNPKQLIWYLPASYGKATGNMTFSPTSSQYSDTHDPEFHADDNTLLVFDNGGYSMSMMPGGSTNTYHSRAVEYKIDESNKTATLAWEFPGNFNVDTWYKTKWYNSYFGDADRLANGNVLISAGSVSATAGDARVFEVQKDDGKVVWEFKLPASFGVYRADRITPPLVKAIE